MNQEKISELIKNLRKQNSLTQQEFANMFGVTYQAVSKWETGKNIPDIEILKQICERYHLDMNEFLSGKKTVKQKQKYFYLIPILIITLLATLLFIYFANQKTFEFKTLSTSCNNFNITGSIAYNNKKSSIYISHIDYCGGNDITKYQSINCTLYETHENTKTKIADTKTTRSSTLEEFLKNLSFYIEEYQCVTISDHTFHLEISATDFKDKITTYNIPLDLTNCNNPNSTPS